MNDIMRAMLLQMLQSYVEMSMYSVQKLMLTQRRPNQWQIDNAFQSLFMNVPMYHAQASMPTPQMQPFNMNQAMGVLQGLAGNAPQQGQITTQPPPPPPPGHYDWDQATQAYVWVPNP